MDVRAETVAWVALLRSGRRTPHRDADRAGGRPPDLTGLEAALGLLAAEAMTRAKADLDRWEQQGIRVLPPPDPDYPARLRELEDRPPILFSIGDVTALRAPAVAVVGTRHPSERGLRAARAIARMAVAGGFTVVSGLAAGIDAEAHAATLDAGGRTVAVVGCGLDHSYPPENRRLQDRIAAAGAVVSQFWPETRPSRHTFPMRNGVMSGVSLGTVIVEASVTSGTRTQARLALAQGRRVFLLTPLLEQAWARDLAMRPGVVVVGSPSELSEALARDAQPQPIA